MRPTRRALLGAAGLGTLGCALPPSTRPGAAPPHAGFNLAHLHRDGLGYGSDASRTQLARLVELGVNCVALTPFGYVKDLAGEGLRYSCETDATLTHERLFAEIRAAKELGLRVCLKPHIWSWSFSSSGKSRQDIVPRDIVAWEAMYTEFIVHHAQLAEDAGVELLCVGLEYTAITQGNPGLWGRVADRVRETYSGMLTYGANWWGELAAFEDWAKFDLIGVNAYWPISEAKDPTVSELVQGWRPHVEALCALSESFDRPVVLTEAGVRAIRGAAARPWEQGRKGTPDGELQGRFYLALLQAFSDQPWWRGVYWWKWFTDHDRRESDPFSAMGMPAEKVLEAWWGEARLR